jgi:hypothetical protein
MDDKRLQELLDQAVVDCYDEEEEFGGMLCTLEDNLSFPLQAEALGDPVEVIGLDSRRSSLRNGIVARVRKRDKEYTVGLSELVIVDPDPTSAEWVEVYRYWANGAETDDL